MTIYHQVSLKLRLIASVLLVFIFTSPFITLGKSIVHAANWQVYDGNKQLFLPEGPIDEDGQIWVPLRPVAERFGFKLKPGLAGAVTLNGGAAGRIDIREGDNIAVFNSTSIQKLSAAPRIINGAMFVTLDVIDRLTDIGFVKDSSSHVIQLRPSSDEIDSAYNYDSDYWFGFLTSDGTSFVDNTGTVRLETPYSTRDFGRDLRIPVIMPTGNAGILDREGRFLQLTGTYYWIGPFMEGLAIFKKIVPSSGTSYTVKMGAMDRNGRVVIPAVYDTLYNFSDGLAKAFRNGKSSYIDHTGRTIIPSIPGSVHSSGFSEGLASVGISVRVNGEMIVRYGFIDRKGKFVIQPKFDYAGPFQDGLSIATLNGKSGAIDKTGRWIIQPIYLPGFLHEFHEGYAEAIIQNGNVQRGYLVDRKGRQFGFNDAFKIGSYGEGLVAFEQSGKYGFKDLQGRTVIPPQFLGVEPFKNGVSRVLLTIEGNKYVYGLIDHDGRLLWPNRSTG